jgi:hypothetical protein
MFDGPELRAQVILQRIAKRSDNFSKQLNKIAQTKIRGIRIEEIS